MSLKSRIEAIIYAAETPVTQEQIFDLVKESVTRGSRKAPTRLPRSRACGPFLKS